ncbi:MAG: HlyD family efflux transporter periplasmic adaptor subunit [Planctomycetaceae bacterium]|nr:HlyD family efflux transporter periplasmic adaptor subunit [Planctomycetaceae bacterium]
MGAYVGGVAQKSTPITFVAEKRLFSHVVSASGIIESSVNADVKCDLNNIDNWRPTIVEVVDEGTYVNAGDFLIRFDTSRIEEEIVVQSLMQSSNYAELERAKTNLDKAKENYRAYKAEFELKIAQMKAEKEVLEEKLRKAKDSCVESENLYKLGIVSEQQLHADHFALTNAENALALQELAIETLSKYTYEKILTGYLSEQYVWQRRINAFEFFVARRKRRLDECYESLKKAEIRAPSAGFVILAHEQSYDGPRWIKVGEEVVPGRVVIRLPNPEKLQVTCYIPEDQVSLLRVGQPAKIEMDAIPGLVATGEVSSMDVYPSRDRYLRSTVQKFKIAVAIDYQSLGEHKKQLKPGQSASLTVTVDRHDVALTIPSNAVYKEKGQTHCLVCNPKNEISSRNIEIVSDNNVLAAVDGELSEGEKVVVCPERYLFQGTIVDSPISSDMLRKFERLE